MKINEVEALVGISKKNIRFYESEGLLSPGRSANGYRDYGDEDVLTLQRIKLLRKLGLPLEEIARLQSGELTVADAMRRHRVTLQRQKETLESSTRLCAMLETENTLLSHLDAPEILLRMEQLEAKGELFMDKQKQDVKRRRYIAPTLAALVMMGLMAGFIALMLWAFATDPLGAPPLPLLVFLLAIPAVVILGTGIALVLRYREIKKGEADDARNY